MVRQAVQNAHSLYPLNVLLLQGALAPPKVDVVEGPLLLEVWQVWSGVGALVTRLWRGASHLEVMWAVGPPPDRKDWELFVRYSSDIKSGGLIGVPGAGGGGHTEWSKGRD